MKYKLLIFVLLFSILFSFNVFPDSESPKGKGPDVSAPSAVLIDADTGIVLFEKDAEKRMYPASTTKIITAVLAIENGNMDEILTASSEAVNSISYDSSKISLVEGEQMSYRDLVYALIIASANDAANVLAEHISGSVDEFVKLMNEKAAELGAQDTHFVNTHGLHDDNHYTTARDLAKIARYAMTLPVFRDAVMQTTYTIAPTNKTETERTILTTNMLLNRFSAYYYRYATGIKTGHTSHAGYCLASSATYNGMNLIGVVLGAEANEGETMSFVDTRAMFRWAFTTLSSQAIVKKGSIIGSATLKNSYSDEAILEAESDLSAVLPEGVTADDLQLETVTEENIMAPIFAGDRLGHADYYYKGSLVASTGLLSVSSHKAIPLPFILKPLYKIFRWPGSYIISAIIVLYLFLRWQHQKRVERIRKKRAKQRAEKQKKEGR